MNEAAGDPAVAPGNITAVSTDPAICTPGCGLVSCPAGVGIPGWLGVAENNVVAAPVFATPNR